MAAAPDREKALDTALAQIEKSFGKGSVMRLGDDTRPPIRVIPSGSIALDLALGIGGFPRGRVVEIYGPEAAGKTTFALHAIASAQAAGGIAAFIDAEHALDPVYAKNLGVDTDALLVSQPDTGEQALEIADMLIRSGSLDVIVIDSVAALVPRAEIEGEMGDSHVGLQARLMSQALRKITGALSQSGTTAIFINQLREKVGVVYGCFSYDTRVTLADGSQEKIGKIVNQKLPVEVLSYDFKTGEIVPKRVVSWFDNGPTDEFLRIKVERPGGNGRSQFQATSVHKIMTPGGWREAGELKPGDRVLQRRHEILSPFQYEVLRGSLLGDAALSLQSNGQSVRARWCHGPKQVEYARWKASLFANVGFTESAHVMGGTAIDLRPLTELAELREQLYVGTGRATRKQVDEDYLKEIGALGLALWFQDDFTLALRSKGKQTSTGEVTGRAEVCVDGLTAETRERVAAWLKDTWGLDCTLACRGAVRSWRIVLTTEATGRLSAIVAPYVHPSMQYKLLPHHRGRFDVTPVFAEPRDVLAPATVISVEAKPPTARRTHRFDIEVEDSHNYFVDGVMVHNSPEVTTGGKALKFYASVRLDVRRIESLKDGTEVVGNRVRAKVVKNKMAPPFRQAEVEIEFGIGISRMAGIIDLGVEHGFIRKSGAWYTYEGDQLGQGKENAKQFLRDNPDLADELEKKIKEKLGVIPVVDSDIDLTADSVAPSPVDF